MGSYWPRGAQRRLAELVGVSPAYLCDVLHRRRRVSPDRAVALEDASREVLGVAVPWEVWLFSDRSRHPAFFGGPAND